MSLMFDLMKINEAYEGMQMSSVNEDSNEASEGV